MTGAAQGHPGLATVGARAGRIEHALRGPQRAAVALAGTLVLAIVVAGTLDLSNGVAIADALVIEPSLAHVVHPGGLIARVLVADGDRVASGDVLATLDTAELDSRIASLKARSAATHHRLEVLQREAETSGARTDRNPLARSEVEALTARLVELEQSARDVLARIDEAERLLADHEIRAPADGVVRPLPRLAEGAALAAGELLMRITAGPMHLALEADVPARIAGTLDIGTSVVVRADRDLRPDGPQASARLASVAQGGPMPRLRFEVERATAAALEQRRVDGRPVKLVLPLRGTTLLDQIFQPIRRAPGRSKSV